MVMKDLLHQPRQLATLHIVTFGSKCWQQCVWGGRGGGGGGVLTKYLLRAVEEVVAVVVEGVVGGGGGWREWCNLGLMNTLLR